MNVNAAAFSELGPRETNQDRVLLPSQMQGNRFVAAIADGIGGAAGGAEAAQIAIQAAEAFKGTPHELPDIFTAAVEQIRVSASATPELARMGTTLTVVLIEEPFLYVAHTGDTRLYHLRGAGLNTLTQDQTEVAELMRRGILNQRQAKLYPRRNVLLSALNSKGAHEVQLSRADLELGDRLLLMTDGVYQKISRGKVAALSQAEKSVAGFVEQVRQRVKAADPTDNYSALGIELS